MKKKRKNIFFALIALMFIFTLASCEGIETDGDDIVAPVFDGTEDIEYTMGEDVPDLLEDVTAIDRVDGDLTDSIQVDTGDLDFEVEGVYDVTYSVTDNDGNTRTETITVTVIEPDVDRVPPEILGAKDIEYTIGEELPDYLEGVTAEDYFDGDLTDEIDVDDSDVDLEEPGTYDLTYTVFDAAGNVQTETVTVTVEEYVVPENVENLQQDVDSIDWEFNETFPSTGENGTFFFWDSSEPRVITSRGYVIRPAIGEEPVDVTLELTAINQGYIEQHEFVHTVMPREEGVVTDKRVLSFTGTSEEYPVDDVAETDVYYVNDETLPYMDVETFLLMLEGVLDTEILEFSYDDDLLTVSYTVEYEDYDGTMVTDEFWAELDFTANTVTVNSFDFFGYYIAETETDFGEGLNYVDADYIDADPVTIDLNHYRFDLVLDETDDAYLMPVHLLNLLFVGDVYYDVYYNGDELVGFDTFSRSDADIIETVRESSFNDTEPDLTIREANFHFLALAFDHFYGLRQDRGVETYYDFLYGYANDLITRDNEVLSETMFEIAYDLDDLHTSHTFGGYYAPLNYSRDLSIDDLGPRVESFYNELWDYEDQLTAKFGSLDSIPNVRYIDDEKTAILYLQGFDVDTPNQVKSRLDNMPESVENVIVDLTYNTGGNLGAVLRLFGYMTEDQIKYHSQNPGDGSAVTYYIESDYDAYDYNWFVSTSPVTFSAANLMASIAKELGIPTIGSRSSGGASSIGLIISPTGTAISMSTNNVLSTRIGNETDGYIYYSIEDGIAPDYPINDILDDDALAALIESILSE
ncbi:MAG: immunoglobulin-like domain-containing protein [Acholeplasmataceae bacterium]